MFTAPSPAGVVLEFRRMRGSIILGGDYYTLTEAAEFIASKTGKKKNIKDVLIDAKRGDIRLCVWFDGKLYKFNYDDKGTGKLQSIDDYKFSGYIQIPEKRITPEAGTIQFDSVAIIEAVDVLAKNRDPRTLNDNELTDRIFDQQSKSYRPYNLFAELEKALIPEQDLLDFVQQETLSSKNTYPKSIGLQIQQEDEILRLIREILKLDPINLPHRRCGKAGTKAVICEMLKIPSSLFRSVVVFNKAWERLSKKGLLKAS